jgi:hypothetical protein
MDRGPSVLCDVTRLGAWHWMPVRDRTNAPAVRHAFLAGPGEHVLVIRNRESGTRIDAVAVVPAGLGVDPDRDLDAD